MRIEMYTVFFMCAVVSMNVSKQNYSRSLFLYEFQNRSLRGLVLGLWLGIDYSPLQ